MKKIALLLTGFILFCELTPATAQELSCINVRHLAELDLNEVMQGNHPDVIIEFSEHTQLPISFFLRGDLFKFTENQETFGQIEVQQTFYMRCVDDDFFIFSTDLIEWKSFLDFITGTAIFILELEEGQPVFRVGAEVNHSF